MEQSYVQAFADTGLLLGQLEAKVRAGGEMSSAEILNALKSIAADSRKLAMQNHQFILEEANKYTDTNIGLLRRMLKV